MKARYSLVCRGHRGGTFYCYDSVTKKRESLETKSAGDAARLVAVKNEAIEHVQMNLQIAQVYLQHSNPSIAKRTWQEVMDEMTPLKSGATQARWKSAMRDGAFDLIRNRKLVETGSEHFLAVLKSGTISTNMFLRRLHNFAVGMHWLPWPVLPKLQWPGVHHKERRAITYEEHQMIINREHNSEIRSYYELLWHLGGSQTDIAELTAEDIDWKDRTISYRRRKTAVPVIVTIGSEAAAVLAKLPKTGLLFPRIARIQENHRAKMFIKRLRIVNRSWKFSPGDFKELPTFVNRLRRKTQPIDVWLMEQLSPKPMKAVCAATRIPSQNLELQRMLAEDLNAVVKGECIFDKMRFAGIQLRRETKALLSRKPKGPNAQCLNRLLLEDAYPQELPRVIFGISLHSYRYAWAERAKTAGMPERYAQQALGHSSKAFARAYSKKAKVVVPSLEEYEGKIIPLPQAANQ